MKKLFDNLNAARQIDSKNVEFWDYFDLYNITFEFTTRVFDRLPDTVFECSGKCPTADKNDYHWRGVYSCGGGRYPVYSMLRKNAPICDVVGNHLQNYLTTNKNDFTHIQNVCFFNPPTLPEFGKTVISARLSRFACYCLFNEFLVQANKSVFDSHKKLVDYVPNSNSQFFTLCYFMNPQTDFAELENTTHNAARISTRDENRVLEKRLNGAIYNVCVTTYDFVEIRRAMKDVFFCGIWRPNVNSTEPPANFYTAELTCSVNELLRKIINEIDSRKTRRMLKNDVIEIVQTQSANTRKNILDMDMRPEKMFADTSVKEIKKILNKNERDFIAHYAKRGLSK